MLAFFKKYKRTIMITSGVLLAMMVGFIYVSFRAVNDLFETDNVTPTASQYSEWVGLWLPTDVQNFQAYGEGWQNWLIEARFELSASAFAEFVARNNLAKVASQSLLGSSYELEWFFSDVMLENYDIKPLPESAASTPTGFYPTIWVDDTNPGKVTVFIRANDT